MDDIHDLQALYIFLKDARARKYKNFIDNNLVDINSKYPVLINKEYKRFTLTIPKYGIIDFYPTRDKFLERAKNKWHRNGLEKILQTIKENQ